MRRTLTALSLSIALLAAAPASAQRPASRRVASEPVPAQVLIVLASDAPGTRDPRLADLLALRRPPFDSYRSMTLLSSPTIELRVGEAREVPLPNGRRIRIVLLEVTEQGRYRLQVSINRPGEQDYLPELNVVASPGDPFFVAGQSYRDGTLVIGVRLGQRDR
ncbi:MAG TPA: hypothetical protein VIL20_16355 [Sandaracinaceae bacterium]